MGSGNRSGKCPKCLGTITHAMSQCEERVAEAKAKRAAEKEKAKK